MSSAQIARTAYRAFAREARRMTRDGTDLRLTQPLDLRAWGSGHYVTAEPTAEMKQLQELLFPGVGFGKHAGAQKLCPEALMEIVRAAFRTRQADGGPAHAAIDASLHHLATLNRLRAAMKSTSHTLTRFGDDVAVEVEVCSAFIPSATMPLLEMALAKHFPFAYRIRVENKGTIPVQLMGRHWVFTDTAGGSMEVPRGSAGVVGQTPLLFPGHRFEYISGERHVWTACAKCFVCSVNRANAPCSNSVTHMWCVPSFTRLQAQA